jgi:hypothetical protein
MARIFYAGADVRQPCSRPDNEWTHARREHFLLRLDVVRPLSVDPNVWRQAGGAATDEAGMPLPWISVDDVLREHATRTDVLATVVAIGVVAEDAEEESALATATGANADLSPQPGWVFLGFDVADGSISGLSDCGYDDSEALLLRPVWGPRLNEHGLFSDIAHALSFRRLTDKRVPEHAPFYVYGLWKVGTQERQGP